MILHRSVLFRNSCLCYSGIVHVSFIVLLLTGLISPAQAQQACISLSPSLAYGNNGIVHSMFEESSIDGSDITVVAKRLTLGSGLRYGADFRYYFNDYIGLGFQGFLVRGHWQDFASERKIVYIQYTNRSARVNGLTFAAGIHGRIGDQNVMPYVSLFPGFFLGSMDLADTVRYSDQMTTASWKYNSLNALYLGMAAGLDIVLSEQWITYAEVEIQNLTVAPQRGYLLEKDGLDDLEDIPVNEKEIVFLDKIISDHNQVPDKNVPQRELKPYFPLDSFQIRVGIRLVF